MARKKALLLLFEGYCEFEIASAISMLKSTHELHTFGLERTPCKSEAGLTTVPDFTIKDININNYDVLIIPGGDLKPIAEAHDLFEWVNHFVAKGKTTAAICSGVFILAKAQVLNHKPYTVTLSKVQRDFLGCFDEDYYRYQPTVRENNILTAQGHAYVDFAIELKKMIGEVSAETVAFYQGKGNKLMEQEL
ncbi:DJ-1/PfpI family protein [Cytobacillus sp. Hm23]